MTAKFFGQIAGLSACGNQFDHLLAKLRRVWRVWRFGVAVVTYLDSFLN